MLACWIIGLSADLMSIERLGLLALSYVLIASFVGSVREYLFRHHALTQFVVTFLCALFVQFGWLIYRRLMYAIDESLLVDLARTLLLAPLYTAIWAPPFHRILWSVASPLGLPKPRYSFTGAQTTGVQRV